MEESSATAKNSLSLCRQPGPLSESVRGSTTNFPFMPGGLTDELLLDDEDNPLATKKFEDEDGIDFEHDLLTVPPGWEAGMVFEKKVAKKVEEKAGEVIPTVMPSSGAVGLDDIMGGDDRFDFLEKETEADKADQTKEVSLCLYCFLRD